MGRARRAPAPKAPSADPQGGMFDTVIEDPIFEQALLEFIEQGEQRKEITANAAARRAGVKRHMSRLQVGDRVRVGAVTFTVIERHGGGFDIGKWMTRSIAQVRADGQA